MVGQEEVVVVVAAAREEAWSLAVGVVDLHCTLEISCQPLSTSSCLLHIYIDRVWVEGICCNYTDTGTCVAVACKSANIMNLEICRQFGPELLSSYRPGVLSSLRNFLCSSSNTFSPSFLNAISSSDSSGLHT